MSKMKTSIDEKDNKPIAVSVKKTNGRDEKMEKRSWKCCIYRCNITKRMQYIMKIYKCQKCKNLDKMHKFLQRIL